MKFLTVFAKMLKNEILWRARKVIRLNVNWNIKLAACKLYCHTWKGLQSEKDVLKKLEPNIKRIICSTSSIGVVYVKKAVIPELLTPFSYDTPQIKDQSLHFNIILIAFVFMSIVVQWQYNEKIT